MLNCSGRYVVGATLVVVLLAFYKIYNNEVSTWKITEKFITHLKQVHLGVYPNQKIMNNMSTKNDLPLINSSQQNHSVLLVGPAMTKYGNNTLDNFTSSEQHSKITLTHTHQNNTICDNIQKTLNIRLNQAYQSQLPSQNVSFGASLARSNSTQRFTSHDNPGVFLWSIGRLGDNLFQYAALYTFAKHTNRTPYVVSEHYFPRIFHDLPLRYLPKKGSDKFRPTVKFCVNFSTFVDLARQDVGDVKLNNIEICGQFQSFRYFKGQEAQIRRILQFNKRIQDQANNFIQSTKFSFIKDLKLISTVSRNKFLTNLTMIGIHVRRTDMMSTERYKNGRRVPTVNYFINAMNYFQNKYTKFLFIVTSDDIKWCQEKLNFVTMYFSVGHSAEVDMTILSMCDHVITSVGGYSWWAGFLAGGEVVYFKDTLLPNSKIDKEKNLKDYFPSSWIGMSNK